MLARFSGHKIWQMINADHCQVRTVTAHVDGKCGVDEGTVLVVERDRVVGVAGVAADVADDAKLATGLRQRFGCDKWRDRLAEIDTVDEDVGGGYLGVRPPGCRLGHIPFQNERCRYAGEETAVDGADAAATERTDDNDAGRLIGVEGDPTQERVIDSFQHVGQGRIIRGNQGGKRGLRVGQLVSPGQKSNCSARKAGKVSKCSDAPSQRVGQELDVIQHTASTSKARKIAVPVLLSLVAMAELDMVMFQGSL